LVARDIFIISLAFDANFPVGLYSYRPTTSDMASWEDIWTPSTSIDRLRSEDDILRSAIGRFAAPVIRAPVGLDPSNSRLSFQWRTNPDGSLGPDVSLVSGNYYLGTVNMGDPWSLLCARSPDGSTIAYIKRPDIPIYAPESIQWFRLQDPSKVYALFPNGYTASDVAFSPDSQWLAFFGCSSNESNCGVYLLNIQSQQRRKLVNIGVGAYFTWSPDGQYLAMLGSDDLGSLRVFVIQIDTDNIVYTGPVDWKSFTTSPDSPTRIWGVEFPGFMGGLEACVTRPIP
jgi:WD40 repeat protein